MATRPALPAFDDTEITALLHALAPLQPYFVQVGAMDGVSFDALHPFIMHYRWAGLLIEPMPAAFAALKQNYAAHPHVAFANCAIANHSGTITMRYLDPAFVVDGRLPPEVLGMSTTSTDPNHFLPAHVRPEFRDHLKQAERQIVLPCAPLQQVLDRYSVPKIDLFICDTEGADGQILLQLDVQRYQPHLIFFEFDVMGDDDLTACLTKFQAAGYTAKIENSPGQNMIFYKTSTPRPRLFM